MPIETRNGHGVPRLFSVNQAEINAIISEALARLWRAEQAPVVAARQIAERVNRHLLENP
jgi:hypothetical protein